MAFLNQSSNVILLNDLTQCQTPLPLLFFLLVDVCARGLQNIIINNELTGDKLEVDYETISINVIQSKVYADCSYLKNILVDLVEKLQWNHIESLKVPFSICYRNLHV